MSAQIWDPTRSPEPPELLGETILFIGVRTRESSAFQTWPTWMRALGRDVQLLGVDLPHDVDPRQYENFMRLMQQEPSLLGAVVSEHTIRLAESSRALFDELAPVARRLAAVNCIRVQGGALAGDARDAIAIQRALARWRPVDGLKEAIIFGAGGAGRALALSMGVELGDDGASWRAIRGPRRVTVVDVDPQRLDSLRATVGPALGSALALRCHTLPRENDALLASSGPGTLVVNATGRRGSPLTDRAAFPLNTWAWDLNYRGELEFLEQARRAGAIALDGWTLFVQSWAATLGFILGREAEWAVLDVTTTRDCWTGS